MNPNKIKSSTDLRYVNPSQRTRLEGLLFSGAALEMTGLGTTIKWPQSGGE